MKVVCVLYPDPVTGHPTMYPRDSLPTISSYPGGQTTPTPEAIDFRPGELLGDVTGELGLRKYLEAQGHTFVVTSDKDWPDSELDRELADADIVISQPFWPAYITRERMTKAPKLKLALTAGIGSRRPDGRGGTRDHRRRSHLLQLHQRRRAHGDDDPQSGEKLHSFP